MTRPDTDACVLAYIQRLVNEESSTNAGIRCGSAGGCASSAATRRKRMLARRTW